MKLTGEGERGGKYGQQKRQEQKKALQMRFPRHKRPASQHAAGNYYVRFCDF